MLLLSFYKNHLKSKEYSLDKYSKVLIEEGKYLIKEDKLLKEDEKSFRKIKEIIKKNSGFLEINNLEKIIDEICKEYGLKIKEKDKLIYYLQRDLFGFGKIDPLLKDVFLEDISCEGANKNILVYHSKYSNLETNLVFSEEELKDFILNLSEKTGKNISLFNPILQAQYKNLRIEAVLRSDISKNYSFTIRKFREKILTPFELIKNNTIDLVSLAYLWLAIEFKRNILISGGTATGKTTLLNAISLFIKPNQKIVSIEDTPELKIASKHFLQLIERQGEITLFDLLKVALRERPDYIIVGEVRGKEASVLFQAMATGHSGLATIHASTIEELENRLMMDPINLKKEDLNLIDLVVLQGFVYENKKWVRKTKEIFDYKAKDFFSKYNALEEKTIFNNTNLFKRISRDFGIKIKELEENLNKKIEFLKKEYFNWLKKHYNYEIFCEKIKEFYEKEV